MALGLESAEMSSYLITLVHPTHVILVVDNGAWTAVHPPVRSDLSLCRRNSKYEIGQGTIDYLSVTPLECGNICRITNGHLVSAPSGRRA